MREFTLRRSAARLVAVLLAGIVSKLLVPGGASAADAPTPLREAKPLLDKTLVAWVSPGNLEQKGSSFLTLIDKAEHFDAIVLGEVAQGKWMAGSDFFRRTHQDQASWPLETAGSNKMEYWGLQNILPGFKSSASNGGSAPILPQRRADKNGLPVRPR